MIRLGNAYGRECSIDDGYVARENREDEPHVLIILEHFYEGDEKISRIEVMTALAAIITQMEHDYLESHGVTPVS